MLFNSYPFLLLFLPAVLVICFSLAKWRIAAAALWLVLASLFFYGWWDARYVLLLMVSVGVNYLAGQAIAVRGGRASRSARVLLGLTIAANLGVLGWFKYAGFFAVNANALFGSDWHLDALVLPLGISFFTFTQIAYLVDIYREPVCYRLVPYALFVTYFPHLIAGPILHHREMMPQFEAASSYRCHYANLAAGVTIFAIGLFKKAVLADGIAPYVGPVFEHSAHGYTPGLLEAWGAALAFGLQLYFDFSGYCDMAIGLSILLGIRLPLNFNSPYKATSIIEFWRRWHMTLSRFLRDYLYIPLGGSRRGPWRRYLNLFVTMLLGGMWHGAAWTFVAWGALHGIYIAINHSWRALRARVATPSRWLLKLERGLGAVLTFVAVFAAWVLFRAQDLPSAVTILRGMAGLNGMVLPQVWLVELADSVRWAAGHVGGELLLSLMPDQLLKMAAGMPHALTGRTDTGVLISKAQLLWIAGLLLLAWFAPNTQQLMQRADAFIAGPRAVMRPTLLRWRPNLPWAVASALLLVGALLGMARVSEFLYFQF
jgi:D-alanyl-lipoteichoic acid acyltransferase DltB (MBOAT superfamily)